MAVSKAQAEKMVTFTYEGVDRRGSKIKGEMNGRNPNLIKAELRRQGINPTRVKKKPKDLFGGAGKRIKPRDIATFSRQLATMMKAGVPMVLRSRADPVEEPDLSRPISRAVPRCRSPSPSTPSISTACTSTWCGPANRRACWTTSWTPSPPTRSASRP